ncbi:MAG: glutamate-5-semialdehyde dehydrogenase [Opitutae bacterium]|nr:glutamate-5-semialdehyde dehydrogenase [Opitutae bacterium]
MSEDFSEIFRAAKVASNEVAVLGDERVSEILRIVADAVVEQGEQILAANELDCSRMEKSNPKFDRLVLTRERLDAMAADMRKVATLPSPLGKVLSENVRPNGLKICKISVPVGVIGVIFEARPNVALDVFSLCLKSGNVCVLKGGSDAAETNFALVSVVQKVLRERGISPAACTLLPPVRAAATALLSAVGFVDLAIPRGSRALIDFVRDNSRVPVIETGAGICHTYLDESGDVAKAREIVFNAKTRRVSVCNALDCLIVHEARLADLPFVCGRLAEKNVEIFADEKSFDALAGKYPENLLKHATADSFGREFLDYKMSIRAVPDIDAALAHIAANGSRHSEAIVAESREAIEKFQKNVDAACVYANASTAFTDGGQFGFGAEIGISTQKLHARGPMGLEALTTYKYLIDGNGQVRLA